jgi:2-polyprenyl-3-methyl-5-hydroxy-6-metoxy-1,4-benzoquinol methylase
MATQADFEITIPGEEIEFRKALEAWYVSKGVRRDDALFGHWVNASGPLTFRAAERIARELSMLSSIESKLILDVGCGFGGALAVLTGKGARCVGIDLSVEELSICAHRLHLHGLANLAVCGDAFKMPFQDGRFDVVICTETMEHVKDRISLLDEISRVLKPEGLLYLSFPNLLSLRNVMSDPHYQLFGAVLMPLRLANWYTQKRRGRNYDVEVLPIPPVIAKACRRRGIRVQYLNSGELVLYGKIESPKTINNGLVRIVAGAFKALRLEWILKAAVRLKAITTSNTVLAGFKG